MQNDLYNNPRYYEIAFSFRDIPAEVETMKHCIDQYSDIPVETVLELACGNSPHMPELVNSGFRYVGIDLNDQMVAFSRQKAHALDGKANIIKGDMIRFTLPEPVDFAFVTLGSLFAQNTGDVLSHLDSVAQCLNPGGLYLLDWCVSFTPFAGYEEAWAIERDGVQVATHVTGRIVDAIEQMNEECIALEVDDHGEIHRCSQTDRRKQIYPQEFLHIIERSGNFEFVGWWNNWDLAKPIFTKEHEATMEPSSINRPITLIRRK